MVDSAGILTSAHGQETSVNAMGIKLMLSFPPISLT